MLSSRPHLFLPLGPQTPSGLSSLREKVIILILTKHQQLFIFLYSFFFIKSLGSTPPVFKLSYSSKPLFLICLNTLRAFLSICLLQVTSFPLKVSPSLAPMTLHCPESLLICFSPFIWLLFLPWNVDFLRFLRPFSSLQTCSWWPYWLMA